MYIVNENIREWLAEMLAIFTGFMELLVQKMKCEIAKGMNWLSKGL